MHLIELPYCPDSASLFDRLADEPWAVFLDSGPPENRQGRYDILACAPQTTLVTRGAETHVSSVNNTALRHGDPWAILAEFLPVEATQHLSALPFSGGALGYFGYDLGRASPRFRPFADMAVGLYDWAVVVDHKECHSHFVIADCAPDPHALQARWLPQINTATQTKRPPLRVLGPLNMDLNRETYRSKVEQIQAYIQAGDCYQVNFAQRFSVAVSGDPWRAYCGLRKVNPAPYAAYLSLPEGQILSCSPEQFLSVQQGQVCTRPIKGTRPRHPDPARDAELAGELAASSKDRAENLMIVDLLRNDLGRVCQPGSIRVPAIFEVESFARVHHLVSTVTGRLDSRSQALDLLRAAFPGGSITGAPKRRAMQIIDTLEPQSRGIYCGAIGWLGYDGAMDSNIAIRTLTWQNGEIEFWAGGGIVADSDWQREYQECHDKAAAILGYLAAHGLNVHGAG